MRPNSDARVYEKSRRIGFGSATWDQAVSALMAWQVKTRSGFDIRTDSERGSGTVTLGRLWLIAKIGPFRIQEPIEVVRVLNEQDRAGYAYGTLNGHPVSGEESFTVERRPDDSVWFVLRSITQPPPGPWRLMFPAVRLIQPIYRRRYLRSLVPPDPQA